MSLSLVATARVGALLGLCVMTACKGEGARISSPHRPPNARATAAPSAPTLPETEDAACLAQPDTLGWDAKDRLVLLCPGRHTALRLSTDGRSVEQRLQTPGDLGRFGARFLMENGDARMYSIDTFLPVDLAPGALFPRADTSADHSVEIVSFGNGRARVFRLFDARSGGVLGELRLVDVSEPWSIDYLAAGQVLTLTEPGSTRFFRRANGVFEKVRTGDGGGVAGSTFFVTRSGTVRAGALAGPWSLERLDASGRRTHRRAFACEPGRVFLSPDERHVVFGCEGTLRVVDAATLAEERDCGAVPPRVSEGARVNLAGQFVSPTLFAMDLDLAGAQQRVDITTCARGESPYRPAAGACGGVLTLSPSGARALCEERASARVITADGRVLYTLY